MLSLPTIQAHGDVRLLDLRAATSPAATSLFSGQLSAAVADLLAFLDSIDGLAR